MIPRLEFVVYGHPAPKGSKTPCRGGRGFRESSKRLPAWRSALAVAVREAIEPGMWLDSGLPGAVLPVPKDVPVSVHVRFRFRRPGRPAWDYPSVGDLDKLVRAVGDELQGPVLQDDTQITFLVADKAWVAGDSHAVVEVKW